MAQYPSSPNDDSTLYLAVNNLSTVLTDDPLSSTATTVNVSDTTGFPTVGIITIDLEAIHYTGTTATSFTGCTRGFDGTTAATHPQNTTVFHDIPAAHHNVLKDEIKAISDDLRDGFTVDLDDSVAPAATATDNKERLDQIVTQVKNITGEVDWKTVPGETLVSLETSKAEDSAVVHLTGNESISGIKTFTSSLQPNGGIFGSDAVSGATLAYEVRNTSNTASSDAVLRAVVGGTSAGDPFTRYDVLSGSSFVTGIDNNSGDRYVISSGTAIGTNNVLRADSTSGTELLGTTTNDSADSGWVGEEIRSAQPTNQTAPTSGNWGDITSITLSAGDWDITGMVRMNVSTTSDITNAEMGISDEAGNSFTDKISMDNWVSNNISTGGNDATERIAIFRTWSGTVAQYRVSIDSSTTYYLKMLSDYTGDAPFFLGRISARRRR